MNLSEAIWSLLLPVEGEENLRGATNSLLDEIYRRGFVDTRRVSKTQWKAAWRKFAKSPDTYALEAKDLSALNPLLFQGPVKRPFEPQRLKEGWRPLQWTNELFQIALRFETDLSLEAWNRIVHSKVFPHFKKGDRLAYNSKFKELLAEVLAEHASPLRRLELWYHGERQQEILAISPIPVEKPKPAPPVIRDSFVAKPEETMKRSAIDKLYYQHEQHPLVDDKESLSFLDELADLDSSEDALDKTAK